jgi:hypothetical protein
MAKAHPDGRHFFKVLHENNLKIKNKPNPENFKLRIYTMKLSAGLPESQYRETIPLTTSIISSFKKCFMFNRSEQPEDNRINFFYKEQH